MTLPLVYPALTGLGFNVTRSPIFQTNTQTHASGREVRIGMWQYPLWEYTLTYDYLPDNVPMSDLKALTGFFLVCAGSQIPFSFLDPDDNTVVGSGLAVADGTTTSWTLTRQFGTTAFNIVEPIGIVDVSGDKPFNVYLNGVAQSPLTYGVDQSIPGNQQLVFTSAPASGQIITIDMTYWKYVRFKDDQLDFEKFMYQLWQLQKVQLRQVRAYS